MIYFIRVPIEADGGPSHVIKIGTTIRLSERIKQLKSEFGPDLTILGVLDGSFREERSLHRRFEEYRLDRELFSSAPAILDFIACECGAWDGIDDVLPLGSVKIDAEVIRKAKIVASYRDQSLAEFLSIELGKIVDWLLDEEHSKEVRKPRRRAKVKEEGGPS